MGEPASPTFTPEDLDASAELVTDYARWRNIGDEAVKWAARCEVLAKYIRPGDRVLDLGCGNEQLRSFLPAECSYVPADVFPRSGDCCVIDLNAEQLPTLETHYDICVISGVLEYVRDVERALAWSCRQATRVVFSYAVLDHASDLRKRRDYGWFTSLSHQQIAAMCEQHRIVCNQCDRWQGQYIYLLGSQT